MDARLGKAIQAIRDKDYDTGRERLREILVGDPDNELAWLWMSHALQTWPERRLCLEQVLRINPKNDAARRGLIWLEARSREDEATRTDQAAVPPVTGPIRTRSVKTGPQVTDGAAAPRTPAEGYVPAEKRPPPKPPVHAEWAMQRPPPSIRVHEAALWAATPRPVVSSAPRVAPRGRKTWPGLFVRVAVAALGLFVLGFGLGVVLAALTVDGDSPDAVPTLQQTSVSAIQAAADAALQSEEPEEVSEAGPTARPAVDFGYQDIAFAYDPSLASHLEGSAVPAALDDGSPCSSMPGYLEFTFADYMDPSPTLSPTISILPLDELMAANECARNAIPLWQPWFSIQPGRLSKDLPVIPVFEARPALFVQVEHVSFSNGIGLRFVTQLSEGPTAINSEDLLYAFQGQTYDGRYFVSILFPVSQPALPPDWRTASEADRAAMEDWPSYIAGVEQVLADQPASGFSPDLAFLDAVVSSLQVGTSESSAAGESDSQ
jgi:hypothetical protein